MYFVIYGSLLLNNSENCTEDEADTVFLLPAKVLYFKPEALPKANQENKK